MVGPEGLEPTTNRLCVDWLEGNINAFQSIYQRLSKRAGRCPNTAFNLERVMG
jgi:hypothetical protein